MDDEYFISIFLNEQLTGVKTYMIYFKIVWVMFGRTVLVLSVHALQYVLRSYIWYITIYLIGLVC